MHFMVPWFERPIIYDVRAKPVNIQSVSGSKDLQTVRVLGLGCMGGTFCIDPSHAMVHVAHAFPAHPPPNDPCRWHKGLRLGLMDHAVPVRLRR